MTQTIYFLLSLQFASLGNPPNVSGSYTRLEDVQAAYDALLQSRDWGAEVNWVQILSTDCTVVRATEDAPSGPVTP